jgi:plasmid stabilization system protein ParE
VKVLLHTGATADVTSAGDWYKARQPSLSVDFLAEVSRALEVIGETPRTWPMWPKTPPTREIRRYLLSRFPFALAYQVLPGRVVVLAVAHVRQKPGTGSGERSFDQDLQRPLLSPRHVEVRQQRSQEHQQRPARPAR